MNRRKKCLIKLVLIIFLSTILFSLTMDTWLYRLFKFGGKRTRQLDLRLNMDKLIETMHPLCSCKSERSKIELKQTLDAEVLKVLVLENNTTKKTYSFRVEQAKLTCGAYNVLRRGPNQKVIAYSIYGNNPFYYRYLKLIAQTAKKHYPDWIVRFYHDQSINSSIICELECLRDDENGNYMDNVDFCDVNKLAFDGIDFGSIVPTIWRWLAIGDDFVDIFLSRDSDFCVVERDKEAVLDWIESGNLFHIMRGDWRNFFFK